MEFLNKLCGHSLDFWIRFVQYLFAFYVETRYGFLYRSPEPWFNQALVREQCPGVIFHCSETHVLHKYGGFMKNLGLRAAMILETHSAEEAVMLRMMSEQIVLPVSGVKSRPPILQLILEDPDWDVLAEISKPLWSHRANEVKRRQDLRTITSLQKQIDRMNTVLEDHSETLSVDFIRNTTTFVNASYDEIDRIKNTSKVESRNASMARRQLQRKLMSYSVFSASSER
jgi:hypothetical protein